MENAFFSYRLSSVKINKTKLNEKNDVIALSKAMEFNSIKNQLNAAKSMIDTISEYDYNQLAYHLDFYRSLRAVIKKKYNMQVVTTASNKLYEILTQMNIIKNLLQKTRQNHIDVFCNAELPGGFIVAINHYIKTLLPEIQLNWIACSYIHDPRALGDNYGLLKNNPNNWIMDSGNNGDLTNTTTLLRIVTNAFNKFPNGIQLYTSDVGIDVSEDYNKQEEQTILLNFGQILCGLLTLNKKGTMITKQFTFFTPFNQSLFMVLSSLFDNVYITKPVTSKPLNSEIYVVCQGYKTLPDYLRTFLIKRHSEGIDPYIPLLIYKPSKLIADLLIISGVLYEEKQRKRIMEAYRIYKTCKESNVNLHDCLVNTFIEPAKKAQEIWLNKNPIRYINNEDMLPFSGN
jgi:uncharacterized protein YbgA (DUF1722 family)